MEIIKTYHTKPAELEPFELKRIIQPFPAFPLRRMTPADRRELFTSKTITDSIDRIINPESFIAKEHYRERLHETQREIERETAQREAREAEEREHREQVRIVAEFENRLESMTDDEWRTIAEKTLAYIRENDGIVAYNRAKSKIDVFDNFYTKWQGAKLFFEIDA